MSANRLTTTNTRIMSQRRLRGENKALPGRAPRDGEVARPQDGEVARGERTDDVGLNICDRADPFDWPGEPMPKPFDWPGESGLEALKEALLPPVGDFIATLGFSAV